MAKLQRNLPSKSTISRLLSSLIVDELSQKSKRNLPVWQWSSWDSNTSMDEDGVGLDSLQRLDIALRLNRFFHMHEVGIEDYLLMQKTHGDWCDIVLKSLEIKSERISFQTSGSTSEPKICEHQLDDLFTEMKVQAEIYRGANRIVSFVPPHHIFGYLFSVMLPAILDIEFVDARVLGPSQWSQQLQENDLIVATPHLWSAIHRAMVGGFPVGVSGVSSTAPMPQELKKSLLNSGLKQLTEVYGSSETGGVGYRQVGMDKFQLFSHLDRDEASGDISFDGKVLEMNDVLGWGDLRSFVPKARLDQAVQVAGINVFPSKVSDILKQCGEIADCVVRPHAPDGDASQNRLYAFVVPANDDVPEDILLKNITDYCVSCLQAAERPVSLTFGQELPKNEMGKAASWF